MTTRYPCRCDDCGARFCDNCIESGRAEAGDRAGSMRPVPILVPALDDGPEDDAMIAPMPASMHL